MRSAEERSRCCVLECDGPGHLDARVAREAGLTLIVVRSYSAHLTAKQHGTAAVCGFEGAMAAARDWTRGPLVVSDRAVKFFAGSCRQRPDLVVLEGVECLSMPNCPDLGARTVWMTNFFNRRVPHRGWARDCYAEAVENDAVVRKRPRRAEALPAPLRELYFDVRGEESEVPRAAAVAGDAELAVASFPGSFERERRGRPADECPVCYDASPSPRVTTRCCGRDFCLSCAARSMGDETPCPWCRRRSGLWNCSIEAGHRRAPFKDALLGDLVRRFLASSPDAKVLVVTVDDSYTYLWDRHNPLGPFRPVAVAGSAQAVESAVRKFGEKGVRTVAVAHADRMFCCGVTFPATHLVFAERAAREGNKWAFWTAACPGAKQVRCMTAVTEAL